MSDTPRTDALSTFLVIQFPATRGNVQLNKMLLDFEKLERELSEALLPRLAEVQIFAVTNDRDKWKRCAEELAQHVEYLTKQVEEAGWHDSEIEDARDALATFTALKKETKE